MQIPSKQECYRLIREMEMLEHIVAHSIQVSRVAVVLVDHLLEQDITLNRNLIQSAALLHDITKTRSFETGENHAFTGDQFLSGLGYHEVGDIVRQHIRLDVYTISGPPTGAEIVNYSDKRVLHDKIVPLRERMDYTVERYGQNPEILDRIHHTWKHTKELENKIFSKLPFGPEAIIGILPPEALSEEISAYHQFKQ